MTATITPLRPVLARFVDEVVCQLDAETITVDTAVLALTAAGLPARRDVLDAALDAHRHAAGLRDRHADPVAYADDEQADWASRNRDLFRDELVRRFEREYDEHVADLLGGEPDMVRCQTVPCPDHPRTSDGLVAAVGRAVAAGSTHIPGGAW